jgi:predicted small lipoprotein YifL
MRKIILTMLLLSSYALLIGCGTQGPLYIPEQRYPQKTQDETAKTPDTGTTKKATSE